MRDWFSFWNDFPSQVAPDDLRAQVGHTVAGVALGDGEFAAMLGSVRRGLRLTGSNALLDICCGNGIVTRALSESCEAIVGVDFSAPLLDIARERAAAPNITYRNLDALRLGEAAFDRSFDRILLYCALQHFEAGQFDRLLEGILAHADENFHFLAGGILDERRKYVYLDTPEKRALNETLRREGKDRLGTWWDPAFIVERCRAYGLQCLIDDSSAGRSNAGFRFDAHIWRESAAPSGPEGLSRKTP